MAESRVVRIADISDSICSEQLKVCVCACVCMLCVCVCVCVCTWCVFTHTNINYQLSIQLQGGILESEGSHSNNTEEHWVATESTLHCEAVHVIMTCERCSRTVDCQLCPDCQGPIHIVYLLC